MTRFFGTGMRLNGTGKAIGGMMMVLGLVGLIFVSSQRPAQAICEDPFTMAAGVAGAIAAQVSALMAAFLASQACPGACGTLPNLYGISIETTQAFLIRSLDLMEDTILNKLRQFWDRWLLALKDMTAQLSGSLNDGTRHLDSLFDSSNETENERMLQEVEYNAKKQYQTTDQGCRFDTAARYMNSTMRTGTFVSQGLTKNRNVEANNAAGSPAVAGQKTLNESRFGVYQSTFCDGVSNGGYPGCAAAGPRPNWDTQPSKTLFGKETIDMANTDDRRAVEALTYNITGYDVPDPFGLNILRSAQGQEQRARNREYMAQMDAVSSLVTSLVGERTPGPAAPEIQQLRTKLGVMDASPNPSEREIRQSVIEQLWDPNYWVDLGDSPAATKQKEVYLQAYNLLMLYKIIEKTEKISNAYAIETANMLDKWYGSVRYPGSDGRVNR
ncbi:MAG: hypothetical protein EPN97_01790 [Alphaproteobacteria bacterium]|nr:MAG: hypothetical protein EPN97_01790 [Alphaproteobacteria bacterium]